MNAPIEIREYVTRNGRIPFAEWQTSLRDRRAQSKINQRIQRVANGNFGLAKSLGSGLFELKMDYGPGYRIYFGRLENQVILLLCGGDKSSQTRDIRQARAYWQDYESRL